MSQKRYGLILPGSSNTKPQGGAIRAAGPLVQRPSIFNEDSTSDSDDDPNAGPPKKISITSKPTKLRTQDRLDRERALADDPTVYQYDEIFDEISTQAAATLHTNSKGQKLARPDLERKPKYIGRLLETAMARKREYERRIERDVQRERQAEGEQFADKEAFVTAAYKRKLEEMRQLDAQEERSEYLEAIGDVRKQQNLDGFYRHLYEQKMSGENAKELKEEEAKDGPVGGSIVSHSSRKGKRIYRQRANENEEDEDVKQEVAPPTDKKTDIVAGDGIISNPSVTCDSGEKRQHLASNLDADSDFSIDSDSDDGGDSNVKAPPPKEVEPPMRTMEVLPPPSTLGAPSADLIPPPPAIEEDVAPPPKKVKVNIWEKRTVGEIFEAALQRYYARKAQREIG